MNKHDRNSSSNNSDTTSLVVLGIINIIKHGI